MSDDLTLDRPLRIDGQAWAAIGQARINDGMATNKRRRHTPDQNIRKLAGGSKLLGAGQELGEVCRHLQIAESTWHRWLAQNGCMKAKGRNGSKNSRPSWQLRRANATSA
jgi:putative transposase